MVELTEEEACQIADILADASGFGGVAMSLRASHFEGVLRRRLEEVGHKPDDGIQPIWRRKRNRG